MPQLHSVVDGCVQVHRYELETRTELSSADILVRVGDQDVVVEVDGPVHYADNQ